MDNNINLNINLNRKSSFFDDFMVVQTFADTAAAVIDYDYQMRKKKKKVDHRLLPREAKRKFKHDEAVDCIRRDYLGPTALFKGKEFDMMFRISRARFERMMVDFANSGNSFYSGKKDCAGLKGASLEAKILLPLKTLAFGVAPHAFSDYFQMSQSLARECCRQFNKQIMSVYQKEYLRVPTQADLKALSTLHEAVHEVPGMFGSLDCMHTFWKNCPVAWHGSYKNGKYSGPSIILEAVADHHMWFWHASYGYAGTLSDINILDVSPLFDKFISGEFIKLECDAVPFSIGEEEFKEMFVLVDGIYPKFSRFVKGMRQPASKKEKLYTDWHAAVRKDVERAFALLQWKFQALARPIVLMDLQLIHDMTTCCLILHNMCVSDRVMDGDVHATYNPANHVTKEGDCVVEDPQELEDINRQRGTVEVPCIGIRNSDPSIVEMFTRKERFAELRNEEEYIRLHSVLMDRFHY